MVLVCIAIFIFVFLILTLLSIRKNECVLNEERLDERIAGTDPESSVNYSNFSIIYVLVSG